MFIWLEDIIRSHTDSEIIYRIIAIIVIILITIIANLLIQGVISRTIYRRAGKNRRADTLTKLAGNAAKYLIEFLALLEILKLGLGIDVSSILAAAGVLGLAVGFGAQSLVKDIITGFFILFENQYAVGDRVSIDGFKGRVEELGIRTTAIRSEEDSSVFFIPNGSVAKVVNFSRRDKQIGVVEYKPIASKIKHAWVERKAKRFSKKADADA